MCKRCMPKSDDKHAHASAASAHAAAARREEETPGRELCLEACRSRRAARRSSQWHRQLGMPARPLPHSQQQQQPRLRLMQAADTTAEGSKAEDLAETKIHIEGTLVEEAARQMEVEGSARSLRGCMVTIWDV